MKNPLNNIQAICDELSEMSPEDAKLIEKAIHVDTWRYRQSLALAGRKPSPNTLAGVVLHNTGKKLSLETRAKISASGIGRKQTKETIAKRTAHKIGSKRSDDVKAKISAKLTGQVLKDETKAKISAALKGRILSPEQAKKSAASKSVKSLEKLLSQKADILNAINSSKTFTEAGKKLGMLRPTLVFKVKKLGLYEKAVNDFHTRND